MGLEIGWPGLQDLCHPVTILLISAGGDEEGEAMVETNISLIGGEGGW